jgi:predicted negative regulator of RcsB-dependent stress response
MGITTTPLKSLPDSEQSFSDMLDRHKRNIAYVGIGLAVIGVGYWFSARSAALKEQHAETAYRAAMQSVFAGNIPLAQSDLKSMSMRYSGTPAGVGGALELAKLYYNQGKYTQGVDALKGATNGPDYMRYDVHLLIAAGYEGMGRNANAAQEYEAAAGVARFDSDRDRAKANAARAYAAAGNKAMAIKIWTELANDPKSSILNEAKVRLGELTAHAANA